ncbi:MAG TPA: ABC transporter ATP-binding protein [Candidatus Fraserbacteria bacterium]|nr:ABC transporter ATP-binding protein [Candidatus Fraserbacteria bacterium]
MRRALRCSTAACSRCLRGRVAKTPACRQPTSWLKLRVVIQTRDLSKRYNGTVALDGVSLQVAPGSIGLLGENGAGKTTFIKLLLGLLQPSSGSARVLSLDVARQGRKLRRRVGYMPEDECLPPDISAMEFTARMGRLSGLPHEAALQRANDVLHLVGLGEGRYRPMGGLSSGMKQRAKLAQALVADPELVLLDEPTSGMDPSGREEMLQLIGEIRENLGISLLLSSHLLQDIERVCDQVIILSAGQVAAQGPLSQLLGQAARSVHLRLVGDVQAFRQALTQAGLSVHGSGMQLTVEGADDQVYDAIIEAAAQSGVQLRRLERASRSLEELFLALRKSEARR